MLSGSAFAIAYGAARVQVKLDAVSLPGDPAPSAAAIDAHFRSLLDGGSGSDAAVARWIEELPTVTPIAVPTGVPGRDNLSFTVPEGFGAARSLFVLVDGVPSNIQRLSYSPPVILRVAPERCVLQCCRARCCPAMAALGTATPAL